MASARAMRSRSQIDLPLADSGVIGLAICAARAVTTRDSQSAAVGPGFEKIPPDRMGLAVPVVVGGRVVAVVYADAVALDGHERPVPSSWPELIEVLARHAGRCLEALTVSKTQPPKVTSSGTPGASTSSLDTQLRRRPLPDRQRSSNATVVAALRRCDTGMTSA